MIAQRYFVLAVDYDGTLATHGRVSAGVIAALREVRDSGRRLVLVTGRTVAELRGSFAHEDAFDRVVAENGAVLLRPATGEERALSEAPPQAFLSALKERGVDPIVSGRVVVATREPHEGTALRVIRELGLELQVVFNKGAVMILPSGITKGSGLLTALDELGLSPHNAVGVGDAENDHAFLEACECAVAVANALPAIKQRADLVTRAPHGEGVMEVVDALISDDLSGVEPRLSRHRILLGTRAKTRTPVALSSFGTRLLVAGTSKAGKSSLVLGLIERLLEREYQFCLIDPEGDYERLPRTIGLGDTHAAPSSEEVLEVLKDPSDNVCVSLLAVPADQRPAYFAALLEALHELRSRTGRPHWLIVDEAHHVLPGRGADLHQPVPEFGGLVLVTLDPRRVDTRAVQRVTHVLAVGKKPRATLAASAALLGERVPSATAGNLRKGEGVLWQRGKKGAPLVELVSATLERRRHRRKYTEGELPPERSFYFRGPQGALNLRAANLYEFVTLADGLDEGTWQHHRQAGDYSRWIEWSLKDTKLAKEVARVERSTEGSADELRQKVRALIEQRYAPPA